jgi:hypothetical protein
MRSSLERADVSAEHRGDVQAAIQKAAKEKFTESIKNGLGSALKGIDGIKFE